MSKFTRAFIQALTAPLAVAGLLVAVAGCTSATTTAASASGTERVSATSAAASSTASANVTPSASVPGSPSVAASTSGSNSGSNTPPSAPPAKPSQSGSQGQNKPFPGIWDITSWAQYTAVQQSVEQGHQPWLLSSESVVQAWASQWRPPPAVHQIATDTFQVTKPGTSTVYTIHGTRPVSTGPAQIWVITSITHS